RTHVFVARALRVTAAVADGSRDDTRHLAEVVLDAPEATGCECRELVTGCGRKRSSIPGMTGIGPWMAAGRRRILRALSRGLVGAGVSGGHGGSSARGHKRENGGGGGDAHAP